VRVLLIEDDHRIAEAVRRGLAAEKIDADLAFDGLDGLWHAREGTYDVILLDIMLPGRNGYQVCADLRAEGVWTPILMLTAKDGELDEAEGLDTGADDYLTKPFSLVVLVARLRALVRRGAPQRPAVLSAAGVRLDPAVRTVSVDGHPVDLTPREFALLEHLLRHVGVVRRKSEILDAVWGHTYDGDAAVVEVYVHYLRRKLGGGVVQTVRGVGYRVPA
jgi:two-component system OmpR family response regulator